jgi:hypothetical protein
VTLEIKAKRFGKQVQDLQSRGFGRVVVFDAEGHPRDADPAPRVGGEPPA